MSQTDPHQAKLEKLNFYRSEIKHEFGLLSGRVSAYLASQSFLTDRLRFVHGQLQRALGRAFHADYAVRSD